MRRNIAQPFEANQNNDLNKKNICAGPARSDANKSTLNTKVNLLDGNIVPLSMNLNLRVESLDTGMNSARLFTNNERFFVHFTCQRLTLLQCRNIRKHTFSEITIVVHPSIHHTKGQRFVSASQIGFETCHFRNESCSSSYKNGAQY